MVRRGLSLFSILILCLGVSSAAYAGDLEKIGISGQFQIGAYGGYNLSFDSDVSINEAGRNFTLSDVEWDGDSFGDAPYWGVRGIYWPASLPNWGFMVDYTHAKIKAEKNSGTSPFGNAGQAFEKLEFTDGLNLLTFNGIYKFDPIGNVAQPYVGAGIGFAFPHVEVEQNIPNAPRTMEYQTTGVAAQVLAGLEWKVSENFSAFTEYKLSFADIDADLVDGGTLETEAFTNHFVFGLSYKFGNASEPVQPLK